MNTAQLDGFRNRMKARRKGPGENESCSVNCERCQESEVFFHFHLSSMVADPCFVL